MFSRKLKSRGVRQMVSKNLKIIMGVLFALFIVFGCLGSGSENKQVQTVKSAEVAAQPAQPVTTTAAVTETQDEEWLRTTRNWCLVIGQDMDSLSSAATSGDLEGLYKYAKQAKGNIINAKIANSNLSPSAKYAYANSEYLDSLIDLGKAMDLIISCGDGGWTDTQKIPAATELMKSGSAHIINCSNSVKKA
jgi:hypothetical protein